MCVCVSVSVTPFQINSCVFPNAFIDFPMASKGFQAVPEEFMRKILKVSRTFLELRYASTGFHSVEWTLTMTLKTNLTSYYAVVVVGGEKFSTNNISVYCLDFFENIISFFFTLIF